MAVVRTAARPTASSPATKPSSASRYRALVSTNQNSYHPLALSAGSPARGDRPNDTRKNLHYMNKMFFAGLALAFALVFTSAATDGLLYWSPEKIASNATENATA